MLEAFYGPEPEAHSERIAESLGYPGNPRSPQRSHFRFPTLSTPSHGPVWSDGFIHQAGWQFGSNKQNSVLNSGHCKQRLWAFISVFFLSCIPLTSSIKGGCTNQRVTESWTNFSTFYLSIIHVQENTQKDTDQLIVTQWTYPSNQHQDQETKYELSPRNPTVHSKDSNIIT